MTALERVLGLKITNCVASWSPGLPWPRVLGAGLGLWLLG